MNRELERVRNLFKDIFRELEEEIKREEAIRSLVGSSEKVISLMNSQKELFEEYFQSWEGKADRFSKRFEDVYLRAGVPYPVVAWSIERVGSKLIEKMIEGDFSKNLILKVKRYTNELIDQIAKIYLIKDIKTLLELKESPFSDSPLYRAHLEWLEDIVRSVESDDMRNYPLYSDTECKFASVLNYPESLLVCIDPSMCGYVKKLHSMIHDTSNAFYTLYVKGSFFQAYILFRELIEHTSKLLKTLSELYFIAYSDPEASFFELASTLSLGADYKYISLIDIQGLGNINKVYGKDVGDRVVKEVENRLRKALDRDSARSLLIPGVTANFFMLNINYTEDEMRKLVNRLSERINFEMEVNGKKLNIWVNIATLELEPFVELSDPELRDILSFLKEEAKKENSHRSISVGKEKRQEILCWINDKYRNVQRIKAQLEEGSVEIVLHPIVLTNDPTKVKGAEILIRLVDSDKLVPASVFIDMIYELKLVERLDELVLEKLRYYKEYLDKVGTLFINVSPESLRSDKYVNSICEFIREFEDHNITIELTEQQLLDNAEVVERIAQNSHVAVAVDDFGSGYSSLEMVAEFAEKGVLKFIKIDGSLVRRILNSSSAWKVVDMISVLGKRLSIETIAEFVESKKDIIVLKSMGVDYCQGYYIAKPMTVPEFVAWTKTHREFN